MQMYSELEDPGSHPTSIAGDMALSDSYIHAVGAFGHTRYSNSAFDNDTLGSQTGNNLLVVGDRVFASINGANRMQVSTNEGASFGNAGNSTNPPNNFGPLAIGGGRMWGVEEGRNELHYSSAVDGSDWEGSGDANEIIMGPGVEAVSALQWWNGKMYGGRPDDLYMVDQNDVAHGVGLGFSYSVDNFKELMAGPDGYLWFLTRNKIFRWAGSRLLIDMTPPSISVSPPYAKYGNFSGLFTHEGMVYVFGEIIYGGISNETVHMLCWTGSGWHSLADISGTGGGSSVSAAAASNQIQRILISGTDAGSTVDWHEIRLNLDSELPNARFKTSGDSFVYSSRISLGLLEIIKYAQELRARGWGVDTNTNIVIQYQGNDDASWRTLVTVNSTGVTTSSVLSANNEYNWFQLRFNLSTDTAGDTPILDWYAFDLIARPTTVYGWQVAIDVSDKVVNLRGREKEVTAREIRTNLRAARDDATPVTFVTPWQSSHTVWITAYRLINLELQEGEAPRAVAILSLAEL